MKRSTITITDEARTVYPMLPNDFAAEQAFKNWILEKARQDHPDLMAQLEELGEDTKKTIDFASDHYSPLGLQVIIFRNNGINVVIRRLNEYDNADPGGRSPRLG